jgi:CBS-domain-containing membrane protein
MPQLPEPSLRPLHRLRAFIRGQRERGRAFQPRFRPPDMVRSWLGAALSIGLLGLLSAWSHYPLLAAPFGASAVLIFGHPGSPLAQPRNLVLGNTLAAVISVACVWMFGATPLAMGLAVGLAIVLGQACRCLHPPAGAVALLGVLLGARPLFVVAPVLVGSLLLVLMATLFSRSAGAQDPYPHHWL